MCFYRRRRRLRFGSRRNIAEYPLPVQVSHSREAREDDVRLEDFFVIATVEAFDEGAMVHFRAG